MAHQFSSIRESVVNKYMYHHELLSYKYLWEGLVFPASATMISSLLKKLRFLNLAMLFLTTRETQTAYTLDQ